ncbi:MAG: hypothetical protein A3E78_01050 [Alphaproteobacteria bacterium RIFCSPHIGHO2_12_FULL_63_12]|nr:MAG: hypothetical protein A3E78_01050 [Alphaproteobacteria bacterium RIFCSPHIGHO2_12_FULL_63_12]
MTLENIYYVGQTVAVVAILMSLLAVVWQMRQSQKMERAAAQRDLLLRVSEWGRMLSANEGDIDRFVQGLVEYDRADALTQLFMDKAFSEFVFVAESALNMRRDGFFSDGTWAGIEGAALGLLRTPGGKQWWVYGQQVIGSEIVEHLKKRLTEIPEGAPTFLDFWPSYRNRLKELEALKSPGQPAGATAV